MSNYTEKEREREMGKNCLSTRQAKKPIEILLFCLFPSNLQNELLDDSLRGNWKKEERGKALHVSKSTAINEENE